jgi:hypothetical protein
MGSAVQQQSRERAIEENGSEMIENDNDFRLGDCGPF